MSTRRFVPIVVLLAMLFGGCISELVDPNMPLSLADVPGDPIDSVGQSRLQGIYYVSQGADAFGDTLVALVVRGHLCLFAGEQVIFAECAGAISGDTARFKGYYRYVRSEVLGALSLSTLPVDGGSSLHTNAAAGPIALRGTYYDPGLELDRSISLIRARAIAPPSRPFQILGNCAGGRNSERLGRSENSLEMCKFSEYLGCTGIEIDLHVTSDDTAILMHDDTFSPRTVQSTYVLGDVWKFTYQQIHDNAVLIHGEKIPTLSEFLTFVVDSTNLEFVWLDPKVSTGIERILQTQRDALNRAAAKGRKLRILYGIPSQEILDAYRQAPSANKTPVLCELDPSIVRSLPSCEAWGPRWTNDLQIDAVTALQKDGYEVYPWTIDDPTYLKKFLDQRQSPYNGILSNYPSMLTGQYHQRSDK
jgi:glycerophosphoryl diester phosphodiesterase